MSQLSQIRSFQFYQFLFLGLIFSLFGCQSESNDLVYSEDDLIPLKIAEKTIHVELAIRDNKRNKGLMYRKSMPQDQGMLFVFDDEDQRSFWMKNTYIPLDIAYINSEGRIMEIHPMYPHNRNSVKSNSSEIRYALEMNQRWFKEHQIKVGSQLDVESILPMIESFSR